MTRIEKDDRPTKFWTTYFCDTCEKMINEEVYKLNLGTCNACYNLTHPKQKLEKRAPFRY